MKEWVFIGLFFLGSIAIGINNCKEKKQKQRLLKLNHRNKKISREEYLLYFVKLGYPRLHVAILYEILLELVGAKKFNFYPEDNIATHYFNDGLDDVDFIDAVCLKLNLPIVNQKDIDHIATNHEIFNAKFILELITFMKSKPIPLD